MANYATEADMTARFGSDEMLAAADRDGSGVADTGVIDAALTAATGEINTYVQAQYDLPLSAVPEYIEHICCDMAMYRLSADGHAYTEEKRQRYEDAIAWLKLLAKGEVSLGEETATDEAQDAPEVSSITQDRIFTRTLTRSVF